MKITRRFFIKAPLYGGISLVISRLLGLFNNRFAYAFNDIVPIEKENNKCNVLSSVVSVHSDKVTHPESDTYPYVDSIDQLVVDEMLNRGLMDLTEEKSIESAWRCIFESYKDGDVIAIKPNFNDLHKEFSDNLVVSPAVINSIVKGLIEFLKVSPENIIVYDCSRTIPDSYRKRIKYPVKYVEPYGSSLMRRIIYKTVGNPLPKADKNHEIKMTHEIIDKKGQRIKCYLPEVVTSADHIINVPVFKSHQFVLASGALKNHYGTVRFSDGSLSPKYLHPPIIHESIADINAHPVIKEKTRLIVMDALFGRLKKKGGPPDKWKIYNNDNPNRLFLSTDPVALDAVSAFFIKKEMEERKDTYLSDDYLKIASDRKIGIYEMPGESGKFESIDFRDYDL